MQSHVCFTLRSSKKLLNISSLFCSKLRCFSIKIFFNCHPPKQFWKHLLSSKFSIFHLESRKLKNLRVLYRYCFCFTISLWIFLHTISLTHKSLLLPVTVLEHICRGTFGRKFLFFCPSLKQLLKRELVTYTTCTGFCLYSKRYCFHKADAAHNKTPTPPLENCGVFAELKHLQPLQSPSLRWSVASWYLVVIWDANNRLSAVTHHDFWYFHYLCSH